jgi:hypothetical protein
MLKVMALLKSLTIRRQAHDRCKYALVEGDAAAAETQPGFRRPVLIM